MKITPQRKKILLAAGAAILIVVIYLRSRGSSVTDSGTAAAGVDPNAIDPATGLTYGQEEAAAQGLAGASSGGLGGTDTAGPDPTTLAALQQLGDNQQSLSDMLGELAAETANGYAYLQPYSTTGTPSSGGNSPVQQSAFVEPGMPAPPPHPGLAGPKVLGTIDGSPYVGIETLASGAKLYTTITGAVLEQAPGKTPYRVSGGSGIPAASGKTATKAVVPTSPSHPAPQATAAQVKKAVAASAPGKVSAPPKGPGKVFEG